MLFSAVHCVFPLALLAISLSPLSHFSDSCSLLLALLSPKCQSILLPPFFDFFFFVYFFVYFFLPSRLLLVTFQEVVLPSRPPRGVKLSLSCRILKSACFFLLPCVFFFINCNPSWFVQAHSGSNPRDLSIALLWLHAFEASCKKRRWAIGFESITWFWVPSLSIFWFEPSGWFQPPWLRPNISSDAIYFGHLQRKRRRSWGSHCLEAVKIAASPSSDQCAAANCEDSWAGVFTAIQQLPCQLCGGSTAASVESLHWRVSSPFGVLHYGMFAETQVLPIAIITRWCQCCCPFADQRFHEGLFHDEAITRLYITVQVQKNVFCG